MRMGEGWQALRGGRPCTIGWSDQILARCIVDIPECSQAQMLISPRLRPLPQAAVGKDGLSPVEVRGAAEVEQLFRQLALPVTFRAEVGWRVRRLAWPPAEESAG